MRARASPLLHDQCEHFVFQLKYEQHSISIHKVSHSVPAILQAVAACDDGAEGRPFTHLCGGQIINDH